MRSLRSPFYDESGKTPAARIKQARIKKGLSIKELSVITGISTTSISKMENNHSRPSLPNLRTLAQALDVSVAYLGCFENLPEQTIGQRIRKARLYHGFTKE
ncbi:MAG: helix-turn-helix domain-containing protein, partial [Planifilum fulgidum]